MAPVGNVALLNIHYYNYNAKSNNGIGSFSPTVMMMIGVLLPLLCPWKAKWAERPLKVTKRSQR